MVLPLPCRPHIRMTVGGLEANSIRAFFPPIRAVSSSLTILMTCWAGVRLSSTSCPTARSDDGLYKVLDDLVVDVRFQQRQFDLPHRLFDIRLVQFPFRPQPLKGGGKLIGQAFKCQAVPLLYPSVK